MEKFIKKLFIFLLPVILYSITAMITMPYLLTLQYGPSTKQQITSSFENSVSKEYDLLILGNSRTYRGLNPDKFTFSAFNFSHDADSYNQIYYKLKFLLENKKNFRYLVLCVDYFQFSFISDTRNYVYADFLSNDYLKDFGINNVMMPKLKNYLDNINPKKVLSLKSVANKPFLRENGQYIRPGVARESDTITRHINRLDIQVRYFINIIDLCKSKNIKVFFVMLPTRQNELKSYTTKEINEFNTFINKHTDNDNVSYLNYSEINDFGIECYSDITHLNESAANRFSRMLDKDLLKLINRAH